VGRRAPARLRSTSTSRPRSTSSSASTPTRRCGPWGPTSSSRSR
jgi:hypothetical protein